MGLTFDAVYLVELLRGGEPVSFLAVGVRPWRGSPAEGQPEQSGIAMLKVGVGTPGRVFYGGAQEEPEGSVVFTESRNGPDGAPVTWRFRPLTLAVWRSMPGMAASAPTLAREFTSDEAVRSYYLDAFLAPYWRRRYEAELAATQPPPVAPPA